MLQQRAPLVPGPRSEHVGEPGLHRPPVAPVPLRRRVDRVDPDQLQQDAVEVVLYRADRDVTAVGGLVDVVEGCAGVQGVGAPWAVPRPGRTHLVRHHHHQRGPVDHGRVNDLTEPGRPRLEQRAHHPEAEQHPAAAEVTDEVERWDRCLSLPTDRVQRPRERDVIDVMAGRLSIRTLLAPTGHPPVDEPRIAGEADLGADTETLGHAWSVTFDEDIRGVGEREHRGHPRWILEVDGDGPPAAGQQHGRRLSLRAG